MKQKSIIYNTQTQQVSQIYPDLYLNLYPKGKLKQHEHNLIVVNLPTPEHDTTTHRAVALPYFVDVEAGTYTRGWEIVPLSELELAQRDWTQPESKLRIVAPIQLVLDEIGNRMETWFRITDLHIEKQNGFIYVYCDKILQEHQEIYDQYAGVIQVQNRPEILNNEVAQ